MAEKGIDGFGRIHIRKGQLIDIVSQAVRARHHPSMTCIAISNWITISKLGADGRHQSLAIKESDDYFDASRVQRVLGALWKCRRFRFTRSPKTSFAGRKP